MKCGMEHYLKDLSQDSGNCQEKSYTMMVSGRLSCKQAFLLDMFHFQTRYSFPRRQDVDNSNNLRMSRLRGESHTYHAKDGGLAVGEQRQKLLDNFMAQGVLHLAIGAQVMLIKNIDETLVNGSMGIVVSFKDPRVFSGDSDADFPMEEAPRKAGVINALSLGEAKKRPVVDFNVPGGGIRQVMLEPETWKVELPNGQIQASRTQVCVHDTVPTRYTFTMTSQYPLILSWAMSIHKSQGQTLERVKVDLAKVFEKGTPRPLPVLFTLD
jgi:ATP-dependent DNA helicase PIF1